MNRYMLPGWMFFPRKSHPFGDYYHTIVCAISKVIYRINIVEWKDRLLGVGGGILIRRG